MEMADLKGVLANWETRTRKTRPGHRTDVPLRASWAKLTTEQGLSSRTRRRKTKYQRLEQKTKTRVCGGTKLAVREEISGGAWLTARPGLAPMSAKTKPNRMQTNSSTKPIQLELTNWCLLTCSEAMGIAAQRRRHMLPLCPCYRLPSPCRSSAGCLLRWPLSLPL